MLDAYEFLDILIPQHGRTSCSDENISNGFYTHDGVAGMGRCRRCMALEVLRGDELPKDFNVDEYGDNLIIN